MKRATDPEFVERERKYCRAAYHRSVSTPEGREAVYARIRPTSRRYMWRKGLAALGMTEADYDIMLVKQNGVCFICGSLPTGRRTKLCVDHDHITGKVRGLLCVGCNSSLGWIENKGVAKVLAYLETK
jgi:hypothetical protein